MCKPGEPVELRPEPDNEVDQRAVAVYSQRDIQLGYIRAERAQWIGSMIREGRPISAIFQEATDWGANIRVNFDGNLPDLPPEREETDQGEPDFWPDYIPPDD